MGKYLIVSTSKTYVFQRDFSVRFNDWYNLETSSVQKSNLFGEFGHLPLVYLCSLSINLSNIFVQSK